MKEFAPFIILFLVGVLVFYILARVSGSGKKMISWRRSRTGWINEKRTMSFKMKRSIKAIQKETTNPFKYISRWLEEKKARDKWKKLLREKKRRQRKEDSKKH